MSSHHEPYTCAHPLPDGQKCSVCKPLVSPFERNPSIRPLDEELLDTLRHARIFITSREKMHQTGVDIYDELVERLARRTHAVLE